MGQRTGSETLVGIIVAFWRQRTWAQAELAREIGVAPRTVRRHLEELTVAGWPLDREEDHPQVYWSIPKDWFPGGVLLESQDVAALVHLLLRVPQSQERARLLKAISGHAPEIISEALLRIVPPATSDVAEAFLPPLLDGVAKRASLSVRYFTASRGALTDRTLSIQRVLIGPPTRFVAYCHTANALRWFRLDYVVRVSPSPASAAFIDVDDNDVDAFLQASVDGYHGPDALHVAFFVPDPDSRWVAQNLPQGLTGQSVDGGLLVEADTNGLLPIARFVVGLGDRVEIRTEELRTMVAELASGALTACSNHS